MSSPSSRRFELRMWLSLILIAVTTIIAVYGWRQMPATRSDWYVERGFYLQRIGDYPNALAAFTLAVEINPRNIGAHVERARVERATGDYQAAIDDLSYVISLYPNQPEFYQARGLVYEEMGDPQSAIADFTKALSFRPQFAAVYEARAHAYEASGDPTAARADYAAFLRLYDVPDDRRTAAETRLAALTP